ncbi:MAG TPA: hypothetical protein VKT70_02520 [Stellaceae bacterium]|nr:hypothetical protein [Stellaceae bacterium]
MLTRRTAALTLASFTAAALTATMAEAEEHHPRIEAAIRSLREAREDLEHAAHDFGGHRREAIEAIDRAIIELEEARKFDRR